MTRIPLDANGYSVNLATGTVHTRYAGDHSGDAYRTRTVKGVETLLAGRKPKLCKTCYPSPRYADTTPRPVQRRRVQTPPPPPLDVDSDGEVHAESERP